MERALLMLISERGSAALKADHYDYLIVSPRLLAFSPLFIFRHEPE